MILISDGPFGTTGAEIGFSDAALLLVSLLGFILLATTLYSVIVMRLKTKDELDDEDETGAEYEQNLLQKNVASLTRAQRRARANLIMKQERRAQQQAPETAVQLEQDLAAPQQQQLSRKQRQKAAKELEKRERLRMQSERQQLQTESQQLAKQQKQERLKQRQENLAQRRLLQQQSQEQAQRAAQEQYQTFLASSEECMTVSELVEYAQQNKIISLWELSERFCVPLGKVHHRMETLLKERRLTGFLLESQFVSLTQDQLQAVAQHMLQRQEGTFQELASELQTLLSLDTTTSK